MLDEDKILPTEVRENYLCTHAIAIRAIALIGYRLKDGKARDIDYLKQVLIKLENYDWSKKAFEGSIVTNGKVISNLTSVKWLADDMEKHMRGKK